MAIVTKAVMLKTRYFAVSTRCRSGEAVKVVRTSPLACSDVIVRTPRTITAICPTSRPNRAGVVKEIST